MVHGAGLDEVAVHGETQVAEIKKGKFDYFTLTPEDFGLKTQSLESLRGGDHKKTLNIWPHFYKVKAKLNTLMR